MIDCRCMDPSFFILTLGVCFCFLAPAVRSQQNVSPGSQSVPPPSKQSPPPPPPVPPPPPPLPPLSPRPPPPPQQRHPPPPTKSNQSAPKMTTSESKHSNHDTDHNSHGKSPPPIKQKKPNWGKKLGVMFVGVAAILQVCVVAFLLVKRRQLLKADSRF